MQHPGSPCLMCWESWSKQKNKQKLVFARPAHLGGSVNVLASRFTTCLQISVKWQKHRPLNRPTPTIESFQWQIRVLKKQRVLIKNNFIDSDRSKEANRKTQCFWDDQPKLYIVDTSQKQILLILKPCPVWTYASLYNTSQTTTVAVMWTQQCDVKDMT